MTYILGISCFYHDSGVALINKDNILEAVQEERFTRKKNDSSFPNKSIKYILDKYSLNLNNIDHIVFYDKPFLKFERILETSLTMAPRGFKLFYKSMPIWITEKLFQKKIIIKELRKIHKKFKGDNISFSEHHLSHACSAYFPSPFFEAIILTIDGVGEWATTTLSIAKENKLEIIKEINYPHSLGLLYSAFTFYIGFKINNGEYKLMGLAPYGKPIYKDIILKNIIKIFSDGSFKLNLEYFGFLTDLKMINKKFENLFGISTRNPKKDKINQFHMDIASSIQSVTEDIIINMCKNIKQDYNIENLCLAGGVALNCVANSKILKTKLFKNIWIQPAAGDSGGAIGCALGFWHLELKNKKNNSKDTMKGSLLGPEYTNNQIKNALINNNLNFKYFEEVDFLDKTIEFIEDGKAIGWFQGRMEFGPRALGSRSILGDPRNPTMQKNLNLKVKFRESFRPFAPAVLLSKCNEWFEIENKSPYMLFVSKIKDKIKKIVKEPKKGIEKLYEIRSIIPAVTHVDYSARIQTVDEESNKLFRKLIEKFDTKTGYPILINTSFNIRGEPIVCSPEDAIKCFMGTNIDILCIGNYIVNKKDQKII